MSVSHSDDASSKFGSNLFQLEHQGLFFRMLLLAAIVLVLGQVAVSWFSLYGYERELEPQLHRKANVVGASVAQQLSYAVDELKIPVNELVGVDTYFDSVMIANTDITYLSLIDSTGNILYSRGVSAEQMRIIIDQIETQGMPYSETAIEVGDYVDESFMVEGGSNVDSVLHVGVRTAHIRSFLTEVFWEVITVVVICWLVTFEFLLFFMGIRVEKPMELIYRAMKNGEKGIFSTHLLVTTRDEVGQLTATFNRTLQAIRHRYQDFLFDFNETKNAQIDATVVERVSAIKDDMDNKYYFEQARQIQFSSPDLIRIPLFMFIFAEELSRSFLPLFVRRYAPSDLAVSSDLLIGLPITLFMVAAMLATPIGGRMVDKFGTCRVFLTGIGFALVGFVGTSLTQGYNDLVFYRIVTGVGYGLVFIASEGWVTQHARRKKRATSTGVFIAAVFAGIICGPPIGAIFANRFGYEATFILSASVALVSGLIIYLMFRNLGGDGQSDSSQRQTIGLQGWMTLLSDLRFLSVLVFAAIPGKMMVAGFIAYLVPLYLHELGSSQTEIGRILMFYGIATIACLQFVTKFADRSERYSDSIVLGVAITGLGCIASLFTNFFAHPVHAVSLAIIALGVGHALTLPSQNSIIQQVAEQYHHTLGRATVVATYRLCERIGMVLGPLIAVGLVTAFGYQGAIVGFGIALIGLVGLYIVSNMSPSVRKAQVEE